MSAKRPDHIPFIDLKAQRLEIGPSLEAAIARVVEGGRYIFGPEVHELERSLASHVDAARAITCANGTDALALPLMAWDIGPGDAVFCPSFTFCATAEVVAWLGAEPVFVDIDERTFNICPEHLDAAIDMVAREGRLRPKAIIAVDLFGLAANYPAIRDIARRRGLKLIADSAQSFGCLWNGQSPAAFADAMTTSFYPAKPLGCYGDGGAVLTNDDELAELVTSLRNHGQPTPSDEPPRGVSAEPKYLNMRVGLNSRLDTIQAAILLEKLTVFENELDARDAAAARYGALLQDTGVVTPLLPDAASRCVWAQYTIRIPTELASRDAVATALKEAGTPTAIYYPVPMHMNAPYRRFQTGPGGLPKTEAASGEVLSLPMHPYLEEEVQAYIAHSLAGALEAGDG